ncbi:MAG: hypothetical protein J6A79_14585 [Clostridia bacterium]|nr:hypothetical protein [Clostridia bacterium]
MEKLVLYFKRVGRKRILASLLGNVLVALGIAIFKFAVLGNDPYTGMNMALAELFSIPFPTLQLGVNLLFFLLQFLLARELIGFGTLFNALFIGSMVDFFYRVMVGALGLPTSFPVQLLVMLIGMLICSFGLSLYQCSDLGVSPYDAASLILDKKLARIPYFWCRIFTDGICALICYLAGGIIGVGTLVTAFGFGPVIAIFNRVVSPIIQNTPAET